MNQIIDALPERCGVAMKKWDAQSLADAMSQFHEKQTEYREAAYRQSAKIRNSHNAREWWKSVQ